LLSLDAPGNDRPARFAVLAVALGVLLGAAGAERHGEDLERGNLRRRFQELAVRLGGNREERPEALAVEEHRVAQHVHRSRRRRCNDVVLANLVLFSLEHQVFPEWMEGTLALRSRLLKQD